MDQSFSPKNSAESYPKSIYEEFQSDEVNFTPVIVGHTKLILFSFFNVYVFVNNKKTVITRIVYYAPREEKLGLSSAPVANLHEMWAGQFYSRAAYTIFTHTQAENATFPLLRRAGLVLSARYEENIFF